MSVTTPTLLPRSQIFPRLLPKPPEQHPLPLPKAGRYYGRLNARRDLVREMDDLSDEESDLDDLKRAVMNRGYGTLVPIGRTMTQQEEKNDADEDDEGSETSEHSNGAASGGEGENDSAQDMDDDMEDLDAQNGNTTNADDSDADDMVEGEAEDMDDDPSFD